MSDIEPEKAEVHSYVEDGSMALYSEEDVQRNIWMLNDLLESHPDAKEIPDFVFDLIDALKNRFEDSNMKTGENND